MKNTDIQTRTKHCKQSTRIKKTSLIVVALLLTGYSVLALADRLIAADAFAYIEGTSMKSTLGDSASSNPLDPPKKDFPLEFRASPWADEFASGGWVYANETGRTRAWAFSGSEPQSQFNSEGLLWRGHYIRDNSKPPEYTLNANSVYVFAQTKGLGELVNENGLSKPPFARGVIEISICKSNPYLVITNASCEPIFIQVLEVEGIVEDDEHPIDATESWAVNIQTGEWFDSLAVEAPVTRAICIPVPVAILPSGKIIYEEECVYPEVGLDLSMPSITQQIDLDAAGVKEEEVYTVMYQLWAKIGEDGSEQITTVSMGDPLDVDAGGITLATTHTPVPSNAHFCELTPDPNRYNNHGNGTVTDTLTGLMWQRCPVGYTLDEVGTPDDLSDDLCVPGNDVGLDWQTALQNADSDSSVAYADWLLPNAKQLESLVELGCSAPTIDTLAFPDTPPLSFWSSTPASESAQAWQVSFMEGDVLPAARDTTSLMRLVRQSDTAPVTPTSALIVGRTNVDEGDSGTTDMDFFVALTRPASVDVFVDYETEYAGATEGVDYLATSGTLTISAGQLFGIITVTVNGDTEAESNEQLRLLLSNASAGAYLATASALGTINDDEPRIDVAVATQQAEGDAGTQTMEFVFTLDTPVVDSVTFDYATADDSATAGVDYFAANGSVLMLVGDTTASIFVTVNGDTQHENDETFTLTLSNVAGGILSDATPVTAIIYDDDGSGVGYQALNDTGVTQCASATSLAICPEPGFPEQDGDLGWDPNNDDDTDGIAGFSFTKLDSAGVPISNQAAVYYFDFYTFSMNSNYAIWDCVEDEITGLTWEVKTDVPDALRYSEWFYSWYNSTGVNDGGSAGVDNGGFCVDGSSCDTEKYVAAVNASNLCGFNDWRLPRVDELHSLAVYGSEGFVVDGLDRAYFPHHVAAPFWTVTPAALDVEDGAWTIDFRAYDSDITVTKKSSGSRIRLVRDGL